MRVVLVWLRAVLVLRAAARHLEPGERARAAAGARPRRRARQHRYTLNTSKHALTYGRHSENDHWNYSLQATATIRTLKFSLKVPRNLTVQHGGLRNRKIRRKPLKIKQVLDFITDHLLKIFLKTCNQIPARNPDKKARSTNISHEIYLPKRIQSLHSPFFIKLFFTPNKKI